MLNVRFTNSGSDDALLKVMSEDEYREYDQNELEKAMDRSGLVQREVRVTRNGKTFTRKQWVKASEAKGSKAKDTESQSDKPNQKSTGNAAGRKLVSDLMSSMADDIRFRHRESEGATKLLESAKVGTELRYSDEFGGSKYVKVTPTAWEETPTYSNGDTGHVGYVTNRFLSNTFVSNYSNKRKSRDLTSIVPSKDKKQSKVYVTDWERELIEDGNTKTFLDVLHRNEPDLFEEAGFTEHDLHNRGHRRIDYDKDTKTYTVRSKNGDKDFFSNKLEYLGHKDY